MEDISAKDYGLYQTKKEPKKLFHTYMRNQNRLYVNFFNMIDRKSTIMIRINSTIFSVVVVFYNHIIEVLYGNFAGYTLIITSFISLLFALGASRPFRGFILRRNKSRGNTAKNIFALGISPKTNLEEYEKAYDKLMRSQSLQIGNQVKIMYEFERYMRISFLRLELSYLSFLIGFAVVVIAFISHKI